MTIDYAKVIASYVTRPQVILTAPIPGLCPLGCNEYGARYIGRVTEDGAGPWVPCHHPNAPTIGDRLARLDELEAVAAAHGTTIDRMVRIAEAVLGAEIEQREPGEALYVRVDNAAMKYSQNLLSALRAVE